MTVPGSDARQWMRRGGRIGAVLVWKLERFGRSALDLHANVLGLADAGVRLEAAPR
jgi:DNA invertase Pin-like site-specific DNA recombinase